MRAFLRTFTSKYKNYFDERRRDDEGFKISVYGLNFFEAEIDKIVILVLKCGKA